MTKTVRALSLTLVLLVGLLAFAVASASTVRADGPPEQVVLSSAGTGNVVQVPASPDAPVPLILDDGTAEDAIGLTNGGSFLWLNRFTPPATSFPFTLTQVQVLFTSDSGCAVGDAIDVYVWTDADGNPKNGATHLGSVTGQTIEALDTWSTYEANITITSGPDVLIGAVNRGCNTAGQFPAAVDTTASQGRSYIRLATAPGNPPTWTPTNLVTLDEAGLPGNWMIRGLGDTAPTAVELGQMSGSSGNAGWLFTLAGLSLVALGLAAARRR